MTEPIIYKDTPLGDYFEGEGTYDGDWGLSSDRDDSENDSSRETHYDFAPPSRLPKRKFTTNELKPLIIVNENISRTAKFYNLFSNSFSPHVPPPETARFQERLRYIICTSQLLSEKITPSLYPNTPTDDHLDLFLPKRTLRYWIGTGGCVIVVALLVSWTLRGENDLKQAKARNLAALALGLLVALYFDGVRNSQAFDTVAHQTLQLIQEIELVSRGYRLSSALPPITRLEQSSTLRHCQNLRATLSASITLATSSFHRTTTALTPYATQSLLKQMHQVYNIDDTLSLDGHEIPSLADLKASAVVMHERRRQVLCVILAIHVSPSDAAWETWRDVIREIGGLGRLLGEFTRELQRALDDEQLFEIPQPMKGKGNWSDHTRGLSSLSSSIKTITAKMSLLKQDVTTSLTQLPESSRQSVFDTYDSIGQDLHSLLNDWQNGRSDLISLLNPPAPTENEHDEGSIADSGLGVSIASTERARNKRDSCGDWGVAFSPRVDSPVVEMEGIFEEEVLEGTALGRSTGGSREERIERVRKERELVLERKRIAEENGRWVGELKDVLGRRRR